MTILLLAGTDHTNSGHLRDLLTDWSLEGVRIIFRWNYGVADALKLVQYQPELLTAVVSSWYSEDHYNFQTDSWKEVVVVDKESSDDRDAAFQRLREVMFTMDFDEIHAFGGSFGEITKELMFLQRLNKLVPHRLHLDGGGDVEGFHQIRGGMVPDNWEFISWNNF